MGFLRRAPIAASAAAAVAAFGAMKVVAAEGNPPITALKYWNGRGLMDTPRMMLAMTGRPFKDVRIGDEDLGLTPFAQIGDLDANLGRVPICEIGGGSLGQAAAINYFVASECGLMGSSAFEAAQILGMCEHVKELVGSYRALVPFGSAPAAADLDKFFDLNEATDRSGPADGAKRPARFLKWYLGRLELLVGSDGFCVNGKMSLADVLLFDALANSLTAAQCDLPAHRREPFASADRTAAALAAHPKLAKIVANVGAQPHLKQWLATRGKQGF